MRPTREHNIEALLAEQGWLSQLAGQLCADASAAADLEQETWLAVLRNPPAELSTARGWLHRVASRLAQRRLQSERRRHDRERDVSRSEATGSTAQAVATAENIKALVEATLALEEPFRETVLLRFFENLEPREIAEQMGVPASTVRSRLTRAMAKLRAALTGEDEEHALRASGGFSSLLIRFLLHLASMKSLELTLACLCALLTMAGGFYFLKGEAAQPELAAIVNSESGGSLASAEGAPEARAPRVEERVEAQRAAVHEVVSTPLPDVIAGNILAVDGSPIANARIRVHEARGSSPLLRSRSPLARQGAGAVIFECSSDHQGAFTIPRALAVDTEANLVVSSQAEGFGEASQTLSETELIELRPAWLVRLEGTVRDAETGLAIPGVSLNLGRQYLGRKNPTTLTDSAGQFLFEDIRTQLDTRLRLFHADYVFDEQRLDLPGPRSAPLDLTMSRGRELSVRFVELESGEGVGGVTLYSGHDSGESPWVADATGALKLRVPGDRKQRFLGDVPGHANFQWDLESTDLTPGEVVRLPVDAVVSVTGSVVDATGKPLPGCLVRAWPAVPSSGRVVDGVPGMLWWTNRWRAGAAPRNTMTTDEEGRFELQLVASEGPWVAVASNSSQEAKLTIDDAQAPLDFVMGLEDENGTVSGRLVRDGKVWSAALDLCLDGPSLDRDVSRADGVFGFEGLPVGEYRLHYGVSTLRELELSPGEMNLELGEVSLDGLPRLEVRCRTESGEPLIDEKIRIVTLDLTDIERSILKRGGYRMSGHTDDEGRFECLLPGNRRYLVSLGEQTSNLRETVVVEGDSFVDLVAPRTRDLHLRLLDQTTGARVMNDSIFKRLFSWRHPGEVPYRRVLGKHLTDGTLVLTLPEGPVELSLQAMFGGYQPLKLSAAQTAGGEDPDSPIEINLSRGLDLEVRFDPESLRALQDRSGLEFYLLEVSELDLVREGSEYNKLSGYFLDEGLFSRRFPIQRNSASVHFTGLLPGAYSIIAFNREGRREDLTFQPAVLEVAEVTESIDLQLVR